MRRLSRYLSLALLGVGLAQAAVAEPLKIGGTGSSTPLVALLFEEFRKQVPDAQLHQVQPPLGSGGSLKSLANGRIDLAFVGRPLKPEEAARVGEQREFAVTPFVLASQGGRKQSGFTLDELASIYDGRLLNWDDGAPIRLILRPSFESDTLTLKAISPALRDAADVAARRPGMAMGQDDLDTLALLRSTPGSFGPTTLGLLNSSGARLTVFPMNGVTPSLATLKSGAYPWRKSMRLVLPEHPSALARQFATFLRGDKARTLLLRHDYLPLTP